MEVGRGGKPAEPQTTARNGALEPLNDTGKPWRVTGSKSTGWAGGRQTAGSTLKSVATRQGWTGMTRRSREGVDLVA